ncbi:MAG: cytochrome c oxidase accessory protein CcoG [Myxococcales bacterium]|nr:cytochrome c oxidase accessory protein CcoG [Myxococcales bacterium]MCB9712335.1 cytochrome c oxidase accessory protein CcoG [Myxococcales bacterium]
MKELPKDYALRTIGDGGKRIWMYPERPKGRFMRWRTLAHAVLLSLLLVLPWIDVGGHPGIHIDIPGRRIHFLGLTLFATDGSYLLFLFGFIVFSVFLFTALFGRAWCGWACPQTVFMETVIRPIERLVEGTPTQRRKLDKGPWNANKIVRKGIKLLLLLVISGALGTTFTAYFLGRDGVLEAQLHPSAHPAGTFTFLFLTAITFFDFAWFREQTCLVVCPYGRFQSVLLDANSLLVAYDEPRGEPRGKKTDPNAGDCVDCKRCLTVCPTGIDIRRGTQLECVQCMACIDACDDIMGKLGRKPGLIRFSTENAIAGEPTKIVRPRVVVYALGLVGVLVAFAVTLSHREPVELRLTRQPGVPYMSLPDGRVQNPMRLRIANKGTEARSFEVDVVSPPDLELVAPTPFVVGPDKVEHMPVFVLRQPWDGGPRTDFTLRIHDDKGFTKDVEGELMQGAGK